MATLVSSTSDVLIYALPGPVLSVLVLALAFIAFRFRRMKTRRERAALADRERQPTAEPRSSIPRPLA
jgi:hypothetical protein